MVYPDWEVISGDTGLRAALPVLAELRAGPMDSGDRASIDSAVQRILAACVPGPP